MSGATLLEEEDEDPPTIVLLLSVVLPDAGVVSVKLEEAGDSFAVGVLLSAGTFVSVIAD